MNNVVLIGRLSRDPELRFLPNTGKANGNFTLAVDRNYSKEKKAEMQAKGQPTADFIRIVTWGKTAEHCANFLRKGSKCAVIGSVQTGSYKTDSGETRYSTDVVASNVEFLDSKQQNPNNQNSQPMHGGGSDDFSIGNASIIEYDEEIPF